MSSALERRGFPAALAATLTLVTFLIVAIVSLGLAGVAVASETDQVGPTVTQGLDDVTNWIVDDSPFDVIEERSRAVAWACGCLALEVRDIGRPVGRLERDAGRRGGGRDPAVVDRHVLHPERRCAMRGAALSAVPRPHRDLPRRAGHRAWDALGAYLRGAAMLGLVEGAVIGGTGASVGSALVVPVMFITFVAAFVPIVGAVTAGVIAVLVALVTAGTLPAVIVGAVVIVVQQLDNDLLAPVIFGRALQLHPLVILLGIAAGGALFGLIGTVFAVPVLAAALNALDEVRGETRVATSPGRAIR